MGYGFYDITLYRKSDNNAFAVQNNLISDLYIDFLDGYKPKGTTRISADIGNEGHIGGYFGSILSVEVAFDEKKYQLSSPDQQNKIILDTIHRIAVFCSERYGWDKVVFDRAYSKVIECGFIYKKELKKKHSKDRKHQASLLLEKDGHSDTVSVNFYNSKGDLLKTVELLKSFHHELFNGKIVANHKWFNNLDFGIHIKNRQVVITASFEKQGAETVITPITNTPEELEGYLRRITHRKFATRLDFAKWANQ